MSNGKGCTCGVDPQKEIDDLRERVKELEKIIERQVQEIVALEDEVEELSEMLTKMEVRK